MLRTALLLHSSGSVEPLTDMLFEHNCPGLLLWRHDIHVFGSYAGSGVTKCERFNFRHSSWTQLDDLHQGRALFTPAVWQSSVFLCGGHNNCTVECFDGNKIRRLDLLLPEAGAAVTFVHQGKLVILTSLHYTTLTQEHRESAPTLTATQTELRLLYTYTNPVLWNHIVISLSDRRAIQYDPTSGKQL